MTAPLDVAVLFNMDNTHLDSDAVERDHRAHVVRESGPTVADHSWTIFEDLRREFDYSDYLGARAVLVRTGQFGRTVIVSDGDTILQAREIESSGLLAAAHDRVHLGVHHERELQWIERLYPAARHVPIDDKPPILAAVKQSWGPRVTAVSVRQGHNAHDPETLTGTGRDLAR